MAQLINGEKKRKRQSDGAQEASRKTAKASSGARVSVVAVDTDAMPILANTSGLTIPAKASFQAYRSSNKEALLVHSTDHPRLNYTGREQPKSTDAQRHYIGIYDHVEGTVNLVEARNLAVKSSLRSEDEEMRQRQLLQKETIAAQRRTLGQEFGTKKAKKAINSLTENAVSSLTPKGASAAEVAKAIKNNPGAAAVLASMDDSAPSREAMQAAIDQEKPRPTPNMNANSPAEVYNLDAICTKPMLQALKVKSWIDAIDNDEKISVSARTVANRLEENAKREEDGIKRTKALRFLLLGIEFFKACVPTKAGGRKLPKPEVLRDKCKVDEDVLKMFKNRFTKNNALTKREVDGLITHLAAVNLLVDDLAVDIHDLTEDLGLTLKEMIQYFLELGARVRTLKEAERTRQGLNKALGSSHRIAELKLPLEFPKARVVPSVAGRRR